MNELRLIRHALALGQHRNFARAAAALNLTQPSLSRGIAALERSLGVLLFDRTHQGVIPTAFGRMLLERGEKVLRSEATLRRELQLLAGLEAGTLAISAGPYPSEISVATAIAQLVRAHPRLAIECRTVDADQVLQDVLEERVDVGVARVAGLQKDERLVVQPLTPLRMYLACRPGHPLALEDRPSFARALDYPLAINVLRGVEAAAVSRRDGEVRAGDEITPDFVPQIVVNSLAVARLIARDSDALLVGTAGLLAADVAAGHLVKLPIDAPILRTAHGVFYLRDRTLAPAARAFIDTLRAVETGIRMAEISHGDSAKPAPKGRRPGNGTRA